jgi:hypothetical protein
MAAPAAAGDACHNAINAHAALGRSQQFSMTYYESGRFSYSLLSASQNSTNKRRTNKQEIS